jgi:hypothetical protein
MLLICFYLCLCWELWEEDSKNARFHVIYFTVFLILKVFSLVVLQAFDCGGSPWNDRKLEFLLWDLLFKNGISLRFKNATGSPGPVESKPDETTEVFWNIAEWELQQLQLKIDRNSSFLQKEVPRWYKEATVKTASTPSDTQVQQNKQHGLWRSLCHRHDCMWKWCQVLGIQWGEAVLMHMWAKFHGNGDYEMQGTLRSCVQQYRQCQNLRRRYLWQGKINHGYDSEGKPIVCANHFIYTKGVHGQLVNCGTRLFKTRWRQHWQSDMQYVRSQRWNNTDMSTVPDDYLPWWKPISLDWLWQYWSKFSVQPLQSIFHSCTWRNLLQNFIRWIPWMQRWIDFQRRL